jgi:eukaryotic-like serine/threonine-protein kinase
VLNLCKKDTNGTGGEEQLLDPSPFGRTPTDWSRDGRFVIFTVINPETARDIWVLPMAGDRKPFAFLHTWADELYGRLSPDGRWLAYLSNEGYTGDVYVRSFSGTPNEQGGKCQISSGGAGFPVWRRDGRELFYVSQQDGTLSAVEIAPGPSFQTGTSKPLFKLPFALDGTFGLYDVSPDGSRFLISTHSYSGPSAPISVVDNWTALLKK